MDGVKQMDSMNSADQEAISLKEILGIIRKRFLLIAVITLAFVLAAGYYSYYVLVPVYQADAVLLVAQTASENRSSSTGEGMEGVVNAIGKLPEMNLNTYVAQLTSETMMDRVVKKLKLDKEGYSARRLARGLGVTADKETNLIRLTVTNTDPYLASKIANAVTEEFLAYIAETNEQQMTKSMDFLKRQAATTGEELKKVVANLNSIEAQPRGVAMLEKLIASKTEDLLKYQSQSLQAGIDYQLAVAGKQQVDQQLKYTPTVLKTSKPDQRWGQLVVSEEVNPAYTQLQAMANEKSVLIVEKGAEMKSLKAITNQLTSELKALQLELGKKKNLLQMSQSEAKRLEETNSLLRTKIDETNISRSIKVGDANLTVISPAVIPGSPVSPNKIRNIAISLLLGLIVSCGLAFLLHLLDNTIKTSEDIERVLGLPVLGQIPSYNDRTKAIGRF